MASDSNSSDSNSESGDTVTLYVRCPSNGTKFAVQASLEETVESLKSVIEEKCEIESWEQSLIFEGRVLEDNQTLQSYGLEAEDTVDLARGYVPGCGRSPPRENGVVPLQHTPSMLGPMAHIIQNMYDSDPQFSEMMRNGSFNRPMTMGDLMTSRLSLFSGLGQQQTRGSKKHPRGAFVGVGRTLGTTSISSDQDTIVGLPSVPPTPFVGLVVDDMWPSTSIQLRLADGTRMVSRFNLHHTIANIRSFIDASRRGGTRSYQLLTMGFPPKQLNDLNQTIEEAGLANSVVIQKL